MSKLFIWPVLDVTAGHVNLYSVFPGPLPRRYVVSEFRFLPGEFTYSYCRFHLLCEQNKQTMQKSLQCQKIILCNNIVDHVLKNMENAIHVRQRFFRFIVLLRKGSCYYHMFPLDLISSFLLKIHPKQHFTTILKHMQWTFLCSAYWPGLAV